MGKARRDSLGKHASKDLRFPLMIDVLLELLISQSPNVSVDKRYAFRQHWPLVYRTVCPLRLSIIL
jgi:hypothetical protein